MNVPRQQNYPRWQRGDREYAILEAVADGLISCRKAAELFHDGGEPPLVEHDVLLPYESEEDRAMSIPVAADLDQSIRRICEEYGVTREQLRPIAEQLLGEVPKAEVIFRAVEGLGEKLEDQP